MKYLSTTELARRFSLQFGGLPAGGGNPIVPPPENVNFSLSNVTFDTAGLATQEFDTDNDEVPVAALTSLAHSTVNGVAVQGGGTAISMSVGTAGTGTVAGRSQHNVSTTSTWRYKNGGKWNPGRFGSSVVQATAETEFYTADPGADGTRFTYDATGDPLSDDFIGAILQITGSAVSAKRVNAVLTQSQNASQAITGVGFAPDVLIALNTIRDPGSDFHVSTQQTGLGFAVRGGNQASIGHKSEHNVSTSDVNGYISDEWVSSFVSLSAFGQEVTSWDSDGVTLTARGSFASQTDLHLYLKIASNADAAVEHLTLPTTTGNQAYTFGFRPRLVILGFSGMSAFNTRAGANSGLTVSFIMNDVQSCSSHIDVDGQATSKSFGVHTNKAFKTVNFEGNTLFEADFVRFTNTGMVLNFTSVNVDARKMIALAFR